MTTDIRSLILRNYNEVSAEEVSIQKQWFREFTEFIWEGGQWGYLFDIWTDKQDGPTITKNNAVWYKVGANNELKINPKRNVYFGVHPTTKKDKRSRFETVASVRCLYADFDAKDEIGDTLEEKLLNTYSKIMSFGLEWGAIIYSGGGFHCYAFLDVPVLLDDDDWRNHMANMQRAFVHEIGADHAASDLPRILRAVPSANNKESYNFPVYSCFVGQPNFESRYDITQMQEFLEERLDAMEAEDEERLKQAEMTRKKLQDGLKISDKQKAAFVKAGFTNALDELASTTQGGGRFSSRSIAAYKIGFSLASRFSDFISEGDIRTGLFTACVSNSLVKDNGDKYVYTQINNGIRDGKANPNHEWMTKLQVPYAQQQQPFPEEPPEWLAAEPDWTPMPPNESPAKYQDYKPSKRDKDMPTTASESEFLKALNMGESIKFSILKDIVDDFTFDLHHGGRKEYFEFPFNHPDMKAMGGFLKWLSEGDVGIVASGTGEGKTAFIQQLFDYWLNINKSSGIMISPEVDDMRIMLRRLGRLGLNIKGDLKDHQVYMSDLNAGRPNPRGARLSEEDMNEVLLLGDYIKTWRGTGDYLLKGGYEDFIRILSETAERIIALRNGTAKDKKGNFIQADPKLVVIDYLQLMNLAVDSAEWDRIERRIIVPFRAFCKIMGVVGLLVSQVTKDTNTGMQKGKLLTHTAMQGVSAQKVDFVITLNVHQEDGYKYPCGIINVSKNNDGRTSFFKVPYIASRFLWLPTTWEPYHQGFLDSAILRVQANPSLYLQEYSSLELQFAQAFIRAGNKFY